MESSFARNVKTKIVLKRAFEDASGGEILIICMNCLLRKNMLLKMNTCENGQKAESW